MKRELLHHITESLFSDSVQPGKMQSFENSSLVYWHRQGMAFTPGYHVGPLYRRFKTTQPNLTAVCGDEIAADITLRLHYPFYLFVCSKGRPRESSTLATLNNQTWVVARLPG